MQSGCQAGTITTSLAIVPYHPFALYPSLARLLRSFILLTGVILHDTISVVKNGTIFCHSRLSRQVNSCGRWIVRFLTILVALELGVLSPLSCVLHCLIHDWLRQDATQNFFLCDVSRGDEGVQPMPDTPAPLAGIQPRAVYEMLPPLLLAVLFVVPLITVLPGIRFPLPVTFSLPPPTPPPRLYSLCLA
ncbi:MAG: hypothetical protein C0184_03705 [Chloroflexus aggregans]|uniref:Uncharacterized protein n=1 Tax=Chloroflexus aggregans TaxID=152260 RepID=A0A2J6XA89_9CHLR|nr:MAG: hypothetical protein C0184_03705 [Chloroflexus aggregans]